MLLKQIVTNNFYCISDEYKSFIDLKHECHKCRLREDYGHNPIQSEGCANNPTFMFIGESPGQDELEQNRPFVGKAGQKLRGEIRKYPYTFTRENTIITNVIACRPMNNKFPSGSDKELADTCFSTWLKKEIKILKPKIIITLGSQALHYVTGNRGITSNRGEWRFLPTYRAWTLATYHPSYVLRCENTDQINIPIEFEKDIQTVAEFWQEIIENDPNMTITEEEWKVRQASIVAVSKNLIKYIPLESN